MLIREQAPLGVTNRDFVNERSWRVLEDREFLIMNHSVVHPKQPEKKGFVRANSISTGYLVRRVESGGCAMTYITQTDPKGTYSLIINLQIIFLEE
jgi:StAR-related lipid transfer protein 10